MENKRKTKGKMAVFDLDGTLIDSNQKLTNDMIGAMKRLGITIMPEDTHGDWYKLAAQYNISKEELNESFDKRKTWAESLSDGEVNVFPDTYRTLESLRSAGVKLGLLSASVPKYTEQKLNYFPELRKFFKDNIEVVHPEKGTKSREARSLIDKLDPGEAYFIGDRVGDVEIVAVGRKLEIPSRGIYVNRNDRQIELPEDCIQVYSLEEAGEYILGET